MSTLSAAEAEEVLCVDALFCEVAEALHRIDSSEKKMAAIVEYVQRGWARMTSGA